MKPACWLVCPSSIKFLAVLCPQTAATGRTPSTSACANFIRCSRQFSWWHMRPLLQGVRRKCASGWWKSCKWSCEGSWSIKWITLGLKKMMVCLQNEKIFPHHFDLKLCLAFHLISWLFLPVSYTRAAPVLEMHILLPRACGPIWTVWSLKVDEVLLVLWLSNPFLCMWACKHWQKVRSEGGKNPGPVCNKCKSEEYPWVESLRGTLVIR